MTIYLQKMALGVSKTKQELRCNMKLDSMQIDNQIERDPLYPVVMQPTNVLALVDSANRNEDEEVRQPEVLQVYFAIRNDIPNVIYFKDVFIGL